MDDGRGDAIFVHEGHTTYFAAPATWRSQRDAAASQKSLCKILDLLEKFTYSWCATLLATSASFNMASTMMNKSVNLQRQPFTSGTKRSLARPSARTVVRASQVDRLQVYVSCSRWSRWCLLFATVLDLPLSSPLSAQIMQIPCVSRFDRCCIMTSVSHMHDPVMPFCLVHAGHRAAADLSAAKQVSCFAFFQVTLFLADC